MSKTIDEKVVSMQFDNSHFEKNVKTSMSTLDKLKQSLKLDGMSKGLDNVSASAKKCDFSPMGQGIERVGLKFSALYTIADQTLRNIVNSVEATAKRMVSALTIDPIKTGFQEYETQINAVQTILANTSSKGTTIDQVNAALDELNKYADLTIYNFTEMTRNIGTFTAAGIDLETSVSAIQGIANLAAVSGSTSQQASTAMYQLSQALSTGTVRLMDWNSVVNAGMGGEVFQNALKETSALLGTGAEAAIEASGSFRESLKDGWLTSEVLTETLKKFTTSGANEYIAEYTGLTQEAIQAEIESAKSKHGEAKAIEYASKALAEKSGKNADEIKNVLQMAQTAQDAATKVKTFSQLWDVLKESAQSGWSSTWKLIIGDFEEAKSLITPLADFLTGIIGKFSDARNNLLEGALGKSFSGLADKIRGITKPIDKAIDSVETAVDAVKDLGEVVDKVINGAFGNGQDRFDKLTAAGYNWAEVQNKVNEKLGSSYRYTVEQTDAQNGLATSTEEVTEATVKLTEADIEHIETLTKMSDEQLKNAGYTNEQIDAIRELTITADKLGIPMKEFLENIDEINGRWILMNSFKNIGTMLTQVFGTIGKAYREIFPPMSSDRLFDIIAAFHKFTESLKLSDGTIDKLQRTFKGLFALVDIITTIFGGALKIVIKTICELLGLMNLDVLDVTAAIGDGIVAVRDWIDEHNFLAKGLQKVIEVCVKAYKAIKEWISAFLEIPAVKTAVSKLSGDFSTAFSGISKYFSEGGQRISDFIQRIKDMDSISLDDIGKIFKDFKENVLDYFLDIDFGFDNFKDAITSFKDTIIENLGGAGEKFDWIKEKFTTFMEMVREKIPAAISIGMGALLIRSISKFTDVIEMLAGPFGSIQKIIDTTSEAIKNIGTSVSKYLKAKAFAASAAAVKDLAVAILILVGALAALVWLNKQGGVWESMGQLALIAGGLTLMALALSKMGTIKSFVTGSMIFKMGLALLAMIAVMKIAAGLSQSEIDKGLNVIGAFGIFVVSMVAVSELAGKDAVNAGKMVQRISVAMLIMAATMKVIAGMSVGDIIKGLAVLTVFELLVLKLVAVSNVPGGSAAKAGAMIFQIGLAMILLVGVIKIVSGMEPEELIKGLAVIAALELLIIGLIAVSEKAGQYSTRAGSMILQIGIGLLALVGVMKIAAGMSVGEIAKGLLVVAALELLIIGLIRVSEKAGQYSARAGAMILAIAGGLLIMTGVIYLLKDIDNDDLVRALAAIGVMELMFAGLIAVTHFAKDCKIVPLIVAVGLLAAVLIILAKMETDGLLEKAAALSLLMLSLSGALYILSNLQMTIKEAAIGVLALTAMAVPLVAFVGVLALMQNVQNATKNALALSILATVLTLLLLPLSVVGQMMYATKGQTALGIAALTAMAVPLLALVGVLALMQDVENATTNTKALVKLATALTLLLVPLSLVGFLMGATGGLTALGIVALLGMAVPLVTFVGVLKLMDGVENATENVALLTDLMTTMTGMLIQLSIVAPLALLGLAAMTGLTLLMVGIGVFAISIGALMDKFPKLEEFLDRGIPILEKLAFAIGSMIGKFVAGFSEAIMETLPKLGECLSSFMANVQPFIDGARTVDSTVLEGIGYLSGAILALSVADLISGITSIIGVGLPELGTQLSMFMANAKDFLDGAKAITPETAESVKSLSAMILILTAADLIEGISSFVSRITGTGSMDTFGESLTSFGAGIKSFSESIADLSEDDLAKVDLAAKAGERMSAMIDHLPKTGGIAQAILGEKDMATFGKKLAAFGECLVSYAVSIRALSDEDTDNITRSAKAGNKLAELNNAIPKSGGWAQSILGEQDMATFGASLEAFGESLLAYATEIRGLSDDDSANITRSVEAGNALSELNNSIPKQGGWAQSILGSKDMGAFGASLRSFGEGLMKYLESISGLDDTSVEKITKSGEVIDALKNVLDKVPKSGGWGAAIFGSKDGQGFGDAIKSLGQGIRTYISAITGINDDSITAINKSKDAVKAIKNAAAEVPTSKLNYANATDFTSTMSTVVDNVKSYITKAAGINDAGILSIENSKTAVREISDVAHEFAAFSNPNIGEAASQISRLANVISNLSGMNFTGVGSFKTAISELGTLSVDGLVSAFSNGTPRVISAVNGMFNAMRSAIVGKADGISQVFKVVVTKSLMAVGSKQADFKSMGGKLMSALQNGVKTGSVSMKSAFTSAVTSCLTSLNSYYDGFYSVGKNVAQGFANGLKAGSFAAAMAAKAMGMAATQAAQEALLVESPSRVFMEIGKYVAQGLSIGITKNTRGVEKASSEMARLVDETVRNELGIHSPAETQIENGEYVDEGLVKGIGNGLSDIKNVAGEVADKVIDTVSNKLGSGDASEIGNTVSQDLGAGIEESTTPEAAAAGKAKSVVQTFAKAFTESMDDLDLDQTTADLEYKLWEQMNGDAPESASKYAEQTALLSNKVLIEQKQLALTQDEYEQTVARFGATSNEAQSAYNKVLQAQIDLVEIRKQLTTAQNTAEEQNRSAAKAYYDELKESGELLLEAGFAWDEIEKYARQKAGYDPTQKAANTATSAASIVSSSISSMQNVYQEAVDNTVTSFSSEFTNVGATVADSIAKGINDRSSSIITQLKQLLHNCASQLDSIQSEFVEVGKCIIDGIADGIDRYSDRVNQSIREMAESAMQAVESAMSQMGSLMAGDSDWKPTITPVVDMGNINTSKLRIDTSVSASLTKPVNSLSQVIADAQSDLNTSNRQVVSAVNSLREDLGAFQSVVESKDMNTYLDGKLMSKGLARPMNHELGILAKRGAY